MTIIQRLGRGLLIAVATPLNVVDFVLRAADFDRLRDLAVRLEGERDEARRFEERARKDSVVSVQGWARAGKALEESERAKEAGVSALGKRDRALGEERARCVKLSADLSQAQADLLRLNRLSCDILAALSTPPGSDVLKAVEAHVVALVDAQEMTDRKTRGLTHQLNGATADAASLRLALAESQRAAVELQAEVDKARAERDEAYSKIGVQAVRIRELETQIDARADVAPVEAERCAWCLGPADPKYTVAADINGPEAPLCVNHGQTFEPPEMCDIWDRMAARAASCLSRRTSPDPLAVVCTLGCGAMRGEPCSADTFLGTPATDAQIIP